MKRKIIAAFMTAFLMTALWQPIAVQASPFFDFNKDFIVQAGYHDNLMFIQHSPGEVSAEDILWMIDNDCLDVAGAQWCVDAGLIPADAMSRPALQEPKTKPQSVYEDSTPSSGQNQPQQTPPPAAEKPVVQPTVQEAPQEEQKGSSDNDAGQDVQQPGQAEGQSGQEEKTGGTTAESAQDGNEDQKSTQAAGEEQAGGTAGGQEGESTAVDPSDDLFETAPAETESEIKTIIETESETEMESEIETETEIVTETEIEIETVSETETVSVIETVTDSETESDIEQPPIRLPVFIGGGVLIVALLGLIVLLKKKRN